jgi:hypothetical protein
VGSVQPQMGGVQPRPGSIQSRPGSIQPRPGSIQPRPSGFGPPEGERSRPGTGVLEVVHTHGTGVLRGVHTPGRWVALTLHTPDQGGEQGDQAAAVECGVVAGHGQAATLRADDDAERGLGGQVEAVEEGVGVQRVAVGDQGVGR